MRLNGRLQKIEKQARQQLVPSWEDLTAVLLQVTGEPPNDVQAAMWRILDGAARPDDQEYANGWIRPFSDQIWAAWDRAWPRWAECPIWAKNRAANDQL